MAKRYSIAEARANLPSLVDQAKAGQEVELTRHGKPVAVLLSVAEFMRLRGERARFKDAYAQFLEFCELSKVGLDERFFQPARSRDAGRGVGL